MLRQLDNHKQKNEVGPPPHTIPEDYLEIDHRPINVKCWNYKILRYGETGAFVYYWWKSKMVQPLWKTVLKFHKKLNTELLCYSAILLLGMYLREHRKHVHTKIWRNFWTYMNVHSRVIHNRSKLKTTQMFISGWIGKQNVV